MKKYLVIAAVLLSGIAAQARETMAVVRIASLDGVLGELGGLTRMLMIPIPVDQAAAPLGQFLMSPDFTGIDRTAPMTVYIGEMDPAQPSAPAFAAQFSVTGDGSEYLDAVSAMAPAHEKKSDTVHVFPMGAQSFNVVIKNGSALVGYSLADIQSLVRSVSEQDKDLMDAFPGKLTAWVNTGVMRSMLLAQMDNLEPLVAQAGAAAQPAGQPDMDAMMNSYRTAIDGFLSQLEAFVVNADLDSQVSLRFYIRPKADSNIAGLIAGMENPGEPVTTLAVPGALMGGFGTMDGMEDLLREYADWFADLYRSMGPPMDSFADSYAEMIKTMQGMYAGGYNFFLMPPKDGDALQLGGVYLIEDKAAAQAGMDRMMELQMESMSALSAQGQGMTYKEPEKSEYKGMEVTSYTMGMEVDPAAAEMMPPGYLDMMKSMTYHVALTDRWMYYAMGDISNIDPVLAHVENGGAGASIVEGFDDVSVEPLSYWFVDIPAMVSAYAAAFGGPAGQDFTFPGITGRLRGLGVKELDGVSAIVRLTAADIRGLMQMGMQIAAMSAQKQMGGGAPAPMMPPGMPAE